MTQKKLIDYCSRPSNRCDVCPYDAECDVYIDMYGTTPACEERDHPERYTDEEIVMEDSSDE